MCRLEEVALLSRLSHNKFKLGGTIIIDSKGTHITIRKIQLPRVELRILPSSVQWGMFKGLSYVYTESCYNGPGGCGV